MKTVTVIGAGLAGCEAALQCARRGVPVRLFEMRPGRMTEAHQTGDVAELVCSNSLKSDEPANAHGLLKAELRVYGSVLLECATRARIPGGKALVVDRSRFSAEVQAELDKAGVEVVREQVRTLGTRTEIVEGGQPQSASDADQSRYSPHDFGQLAQGDMGLTVVATGPLTSGPMAEALQNLLGTGRLFFYDAIAPILDAESIDRNTAFEGSRYGVGSDYLNCPMTEAEYGAFVDALLEAELHPLHEFEAAPFFEGCLPVEEIARRGRLALAFGPMKPVGLVDPRTGRRPFAVVQLRRENEAGTMYNMVGFQTRLRRPEQERVFRMVPGLGQAAFLRCGSIHRNTFLDSPRVLLPTLQTRMRPDLLVAGQLTGVEGYVESIAAGLVAGVNAARLACEEEPLTWPADTMLGGLLRYVAGGSENLGQSPAAKTRPQSGTVPVFRFQPMNANFGLLPPGTTGHRGRHRKQLLSESALTAAREFSRIVRQHLDRNTERHARTRTEDFLMKTLPDKATDMMDWTWSDIEPHYQELSGRTIAAATAEQFLTDWTRLHDRVEEVGSRLSVAKDANTADKDAEARFNRFIEHVYPKMQEAEQQLKDKLLKSGAKPAGFELPLRKMQTEAAIYRDANLPLMVEQQKLGTEYGKISGGQTVQWEGKEVTVTQMRPVLFETDRARREAAWRLTSQRQLADRGRINDLWQRFLKLRLQLAANAGFKDYRSFRWQEMLRFDYTPENCRQFHDAIESAVVPAARRIYDRRRKELGVDKLRPWDLDVDPLGRPALAPFQTQDQFRSGVHSMLAGVDSEIAGQFKMMIDEGLLDLENRKNKAPGGYCTSFDAAQRPFIFMNAVGLHGDVMTLVHEAGHAVHSFAAGRLPWFQQRQVGMEFAEVGSMAMELLASPFFARKQGGFYTAEDAERALHEKLERDILFWPYMAVVDAFQHWVYQNPTDAMEPANCDRQWLELWQRFMAGVDWSGFEAECATGWHRKLHIFLVPFYYVEYGLAQLGAAQVWANSLKDHSAAVQAYRRSLALGGTKSLPELYSTAGARFAFDSASLAAVVSLIEQRLGN